MKLSTEEKTLDYFNNLAKGLSHPDLYESKGKKLADLISQRMQQKIIISQITLPSQLYTKQLKLEKKPAEPYVESEQTLLKKVQNQKINLQEKMIELQKQQYELKSKIKASSSKQKVLYDPTASQQGNDKLKQLIKQKRRFQKSLQRRNKQLMEQYRQKSIEEMRQLQQMIQRRKEQKRVEVLQNLKSLQLKSAERKEILEKGKKAFKETKDNNQYLYLVNSSKDLSAREQRERQYLKKLEEFKKGLKVDFQQIKEHQRKYNEHLQQSQVRLEQKSLERSQVLHQRSKSYADNYFRIVTKARIEQQKVEQYERANHGHDIKERICKFQQKLSTQFKPKISKQSSFKPLKQTMSAHALTTAQQRQKGMEYLQLAKKLKDIQKEKLRRATHGSPQAKHQYKDYTKTLKYKGQETAQNQFSSLVKSSRSVSDYESATKALTLARQIEAKSKLTSDRKLLNSVQNKIDFLNALQ